MTGDYVRPATFTKDGGTLQLEGIHLMSQDFFISSGPWTSAQGLKAPDGTVWSSYNDKNRTPYRPADRVFEALGSKDLAKNFVLLDGQINGMKQRLWRFQSPIAVDSIQKQITASAKLETYECKSATECPDRAAQLITIWMSQIRQVKGPSCYRAARTKG